MKRRALNALVLLVTISVSGLSCNRNTGDRPTQQDKSGEHEIIKIELENRTGASQEVEVITLESGDQVVMVPGDGWATMDVPVKVPGRYKIEVRLLSGPVAGVSCWVEDYHNNKDDRQYNITGSMEVPVSDQKSQLVTVSRDGSPLNQGLHKMKLHVDGGMAGIDAISFTLLKKHRETPQVLTQHTKGEQWKVVWSDEFEESGSPDTSKWTYDIGNWGWGNNELQYYTEGRSENARIENGNLVIESHKNDLQEKWTSARLTTRGKTSFIYGKIEIRAKVPVEKGNWTAGWTLGDAYVDELSWPYCGEIDIMECVGYEIDDSTGNGLHHASVHCGAYYFKLNNQPTAITEVKNMGEEFHLYAIEWTPDYIKAYVDDLHYFTYEDTSDSLTWPYNEPQNLILNLAMGGGWGGARGMDESVTSQKIVIDYIRVYERR